MKFGDLTSFLSYHISADGWPNHAVRGHHSRKKKTFTRSSQIIGLSTFKYDYRPTVSLVEFVIHLF